MRDIMRPLNPSATCQYLIHDMPRRQHEIPFLGKKIGLFPLKSFSIALATCTILGMGNSWADDKTVTGLLVVDYSERVESPIPKIETIQIPRQGRVDGLEVPRWIETMQFRGETFTVDFSGCFDGDDGLGNGGVAYLLLHERRNGDNNRRLVLKANVTRGIMECLRDENSGKWVAPDPFTGHQSSSKIASMMVILNQVFRADPDSNGLSNDAEIRDFLKIQDAFVLDRARIGEGFEMVDGSGSNVVSHEVSLRFHEGGTPNLITNPFKPVE